jgi:hypothetical protein
MGPKITNVKGFIVLDSSMWDRNSSQKKKEGRKREINKERKKERKKEKERKRE